MPVTNDPAAVRASLLAAIKSSNYDPTTKKNAPGLSSGEVDKLLKEIKKDGVTDDEVKVVVDTLVEALKSGYDTSTPREQKNIGRLLDTLDRLKPGAIADKAQFTQNGATSWLSLLQARAGGAIPTPPPTPPPVVTPPVTPVTGTVSPLPAKGFDGASLGVSSSGDVVVSGKSQSLQLRGNVDATALLSLLKPGQLQSLDAGSKTALVAKLVSELTSSATGLPIDPATPPKFQAVLASMAALGMLAELAPSLTAAQSTQLLGLSGKTPSLMQEALLRRALAAAPATPVVTAALAACPAADDAAKVKGEPDKLLAAYDTFRAENGRADYSDVKGGAVTSALACLAFAKGQVAVDNIGKGLGIWAAMDGNSYSLSADEAKAVLTTLTPYIDNASATNLVFGAFVSDAPKNIAALQNAAVVAKLSPLLAAARPTLAGVPLSAPQAALVTKLLAGIKDDAAVAALGRSLAQAHATFSTTTTSWGTPQPPKEPLSDAAFAIFERAAVVAFEARGGTADGMIDIRSLESAITSDAKAIGDSVKPLLNDLSQGVIRDRNATPPTSIAISSQLASELTGLLSTTTRSIMSAPNIVAAAVVVAAKNGGKIDGAAAQQLSKIIADYRGEFPAPAGGPQLLDFNKLARIASFAVEGKQVPLCTINGQSVKIAELYTKVGEAVMGSIDKADLRHPWMADRWGLRAKVSVELLDVIAQKSSEGRGPVFVLQQQFPNAKIDVLATGLDGEHQRFIYQVQDGMAAPKFFAEGSDGTVSKYDTQLRGLEPVLFSASVKRDGSFDVAVPAGTRKIAKYPLQTPWGPGTRIDVGYYDANTRLQSDEGKPFTTPYKVAQGRITGYKPDGSYTVEYKDAAQKITQKSMSLDEIKKFNAPHFFAANGERFSDVTMNIKTDADLKGFLDGANPIIQRFLPADGSLLKLSPPELAKKQRECVAALMAYTHERIKYPAEGAGADPESVAYHKLDASGMFNLGELVKLKKGVCRHQCILEHLLLQRAGIDSRLASGAANTSTGDFRGFHIWTEIILADDARYLSDQTWNDVAIPLWEGAYSVRKEREEMYDRTSQYDRNIVN